MLKGVGSYNFMRLWPLNFRKAWVWYLKMNKHRDSRRFTSALLALGWGCLFGASLQAAPEFKIRYNPKFPCLEVMDGKAQKITDISEGAKEEVVVSGKSSVAISFMKGASGKPEVTMSNAKSPLSEMELEAFGLSVGLKPEGVVTVRFGADNKPQFEMDRTGGARFLMADLGNLDTAAGKELSSVPGSLSSPDQPAVANPADAKKAMDRFQQRLSAWKRSNGKGGWSNRPGKVLDCGFDATVTYRNEPERTLMDGEAVQSGAEISVGTSEPLSFQSGPGVYHQALPGTVLVLSPLEAGAKDLKVTLKQGTLMTQLNEPLVAPRLSVCGLDNGVVVQTTDGLYQISKTGSAAANVSVLEGTVRLVEEAGAAVVANLGANQTLAWPSERAPKALAKGSPEAVSLAKLKNDSRESYLVDMVEDAIGAVGPVDAQQVLGSAIEKSEPDLTRKTAVESAEIRPDLRPEITQVTGVKDLPLSDAEAFAKRADPWMRAEPSPTSCVGKVLWMEGQATRADGLPLRRGQILKTGETLQTSANGRVLFVAAPGVIAEIQPASTVRMVESTGNFQSGTLVTAKAVLENPRGKAYVSIIKGFGEKVQAELRTPRGVLRDQSTPPQGNQT